MVFSWSQEGVKYFILERLSSCGKQNCTLIPGALFNKKDNTKVSGHRLGVTGHNNEIFLSKSTLSELHYYMFKRKSANDTAKKGM